MKNDCTFNNYSLVDSRESTSEGLRRPMLVKRELNKKLNCNEEKKQLNELLGEDEDDLVIEDDKSSDSDNFKPIKLHDRKLRIYILKIFYNNHFCAWKIL